MAESDLKQLAVTAAIWPWRNPPVAAPVRRIRPIAILLRSLIPALVGAWLWYRYGHRISGMVLLAVAGVLAGIGFVLPKVSEWIDRGALRVGTAVATGLTWFLLVPFFYIVFTFGRLVLLVTGQDPLRRRRRAGETSYWVAHPGERPVESYRRQF